MQRITKMHVTYYDEEIPGTLPGFEKWEFTSGPTTGADFKHFARCFKRVIEKKVAPLGMQLVGFSRGHYFLSGFIEQGGSYVYFSISDVRYFPGQWHREILIRTAKSAHDYTGGSNGYTTLNDFEKNVARLLRCS